MTTAQQRYVRLESDRHQFLDTAVDCSELTLPYLIRDDNETGMNHKRLVTPWQSVGAKAVVTLAAKLMLALLPPQTTFFKLQVKEDKLGEEITPEIKSELDLSFSKMERTIMEAIAATNDRVVVHQALKHLIVGGNALIYMGKDGLKHYPLNRYVVNRDGNGNVIEIVTKERISKELVDKQISPAQPNNVSGDETSHDKEVDVFTHVRLDNGRWRWHQECYGKLMPGSQSSAPKNASPWFCLLYTSDAADE